VVTVNQTLGKTYQYRVVSLCDCIVVRELDKCSSIMLCIYLHIFIFIFFYYHRYYHK